jgi:fatty acid desaturase
VRKLGEAKSGSAVAALEGYLAFVSQVISISAAFFFFNGLNYHSVHHAFPSIPFYHLREAHTRIRDYCTQKNVPLKEEPGYARVALSIIRKPTFVEPMNRMPNSQKA